MAQIWRAAALYVRIAQVVAQLRNDRQQVDGELAQLRLQAELGELAVDLLPIVPELRYHLGDANVEGGGSPDLGHLLAAVHGLIRMLATGLPVLLCLVDLQPV